MTTAASIPIERHDGNDVATGFAFNHYLATNDELVITHKTTAGVVTTPILDTDYTVAGKGTAAITVTFPIGGSAYSTLASGSPAERLTFVRATDLDRLVNMSAGFFFSSLNAAGDKMQRQIQELSEKIGRAALQTVSNDDAVPTLEEILSGAAALDISALDALATLSGTDLFHVNDGADKKMVASAIVTYILTQFINTSAGAGDVGKGIKLDAAGQIALNMLKDATASAKGIASFSSGNFTVSSGAVSLLGKYAGALKDSAHISIIGAAGGAITAGLSQARWKAPCAGTLTKATALLDQSGSIVIDIWKKPYATYPPTNGESITNGAELTVAGAIKGQDADLSPTGSNWTIDFVADDIFFFNIDSAGTATSGTIILDYIRTGA